MMLAKLEGGKPLRNPGKDLMKALHEFGSAAGLFKTIKIKRMGGNDEKSAESDASLPFQIRVSMDDGPPFNLVDVGYGVSQVLPILVDAMMHPQRMLLLQQPEVHLHPKAQAELGTFLGKLATEHQSAPIIIETHSDYLLDRIRMDVRDKRGVKSKDVQILYCGRSTEGVTITPISIDDNGNLVDVPKGYREFFLDEERRFLEG
jgi:predicted ATPase